MKLPPTNMVKNLYYCGACKATALALAAALGVKLSRLLGEKAP